MHSVKTLSGGHQAEAMGFRRSFSKHYTHSHIQLNKVCILWKYTEQWASSSSNGYQMKLFETLYTFKHTIEQSIHSVKVHWVVGLEQKQWVSEEVFPHITHIQTYNWTTYALCESSLSGGLPAEAMARRSFLKQYTHANIQLNKVCALWKYTEWWASSRSNGFQKKFLKTLYKFKHTIEQCMRCVKTLSGGHQAELMGFRRSFSKHYTHSNIQLNKVCILWKYTEWWVWSRSNGLQKKFFKTLYTFKHTIEQSIRSVKVHWVMGFKQKQWLSEELLPHIIHIQTYNWTRYALCESSLSGEIQTEAMPRRRKFLKHDTHSNIQLK